MKHLKKKKRQRPPISKPKEPAGFQNPTSQIDEQSRALNGLTDGIASFSIEEHVAASEISENLTETASSSSANRDDDSTETFWTLTETGSSSSGSSGLSNCDSYNHRIGGKVSKGGRGRKVIAATGMVSTVIGKDYARTFNKRRGGSKWKGHGDEGTTHEDAEQFLCSMLSEDCELGMDLVKDVLHQCAYDVEKALDILLELSAPSSDLPNSSQHNTSNTQSKDNWANLENLASSSNDVLYMGINDRNYFDVLVNNCENRPPSGPKTPTEVTHDVLLSLFNTKKSSKHEPGTMNWRKVVKKMESFGQIDFPTQDTTKNQYVPTILDDYQTYRTPASQHYDSMKSYYHKAATAYASGKREYAAYLSDQGRMCNEKARQADKRASNEIFDSRNKKFENLITIDLHGQHVKQGMKLLKLHLLFGAYVRSVRVFRVITGCGSHGVGRSKLKQAVVNLLEAENIYWKEENRGTLLIKLNGQREFGFLDSGSDSDSE